MKINEIIFMTEHNKNENDNEKQMTQIAELS